VREALFSALEVWLGGPGALIGAQVLDLYAGSGALGIEALSRGASTAVFVEKDFAALKCLERNLNRLGLEERSRVVRGEADTVLKRLEATGERFDAVLVDPPFRSSEPVAALAVLADGSLLRDGGIAVVEHPANQTGEYPPGLELLRTRAYGSVALSFLRRPGTTPTPSRPENGHE
jgi:16S rRNA (guanine966-N2)-methyltransferase